MITPEILEEFKEAMKLGDDEDANLTRILTASHQYLAPKCGNRDIATDEAYKELVFNRARYAYNDAVEHFDDNFLSNRLSQGLEKAIEALEGDE